MTETKKKPKKFILRRLVVAALVLALAFALAMGANAASGGKLFDGIATYTLFGYDGTSYEMALNAKALEQAGENTILYAFGDQEGEKTLMAYKDSEGNFRLKDVDLSSGPEEILEKIKVGFESEAAKAADAP